MATESYNGQQDQIFKTALKFRVWAMEAIILLVTISITFSSVRSLCRPTRVRDSFLITHPCEMPTLALGQDIAHLISSQSFSPVIFPISSADQQLCCMSTLGLLRPERSRTICCREFQIQHQVNENSLKQARSLAGGSPALDDSLRAPDLRTSIVPLLFHRTL